MSDKPIVHYNTFAAVGIYTQEYDDGRTFRFARLWALDHPKLGQSEIRTSKVLSFDASSGRLETLNTVYVPEVIE